MVVYLRQLLLGALAGAGIVAGQSSPAPVRIVLVGDSTVAIKNGWGPGFCARAASEVECINRARNGRSSGSYRAEGLWDGVMEELRKPADKTWVLIQFGHNDQPGKPGRSTDLKTEFPANLRRYVEEARGAGANPVLVTPLTRRTFRNGKVADDLGPWSDAARRVAKEAGVPLLDLNAESLAAVQTMGGREANTLAMAPPPKVVEDGDPDNSVAAPKAEPNTAEPNGETPPVFDYTHLGPKGSAYFGAMVWRELTAAVPALIPYLKPQH